MHAVAVAHTHVPGKMAEVVLLLVGSTRVDAF
jgi:hypothetical protein